MGAGFSRRDLTWKGDELFHGRRRLARVVPDETYPLMWRIQWPDGSASMMVNRSRAKDAALAISAANIKRARADLSGSQSAKAARAVGDTRKAPA